jgi:nucleotide-binding universal stress UspA family protein
MTDDPKAGDRKILVCYDGSPESERALMRAVELASAVPVHVTVVSVAESLYPMREWDGMVDPAEEQEHRRLLARATQTLADHGIDAATVEPIGDVADRIVELAREMDAALVVVGTRHHGIVRRLLFASVSEEVVADAPCDLLVVR